jgi:Spy/CpxP family protein refolding chaperone
MIRLGSRLIPIILILLAALVVPATASAQATQPADRPGGAGGAGGPGPAAMLQRVRGIVDDLKLSDEQKAKVEDVMQQARQDLRQMMQIARDLPPPERREKVRNFVLDLREKIAATLPY